jgi:hypothetical protein
MQQRKWLFMQVYIASIFKHELPYMKYACLTPFRPMVNLFIMLCMQLVPPSPLNRNRKWFSI